MKFRIARYQFLLINSTIHRIDLCRAGLSLNSMGKPVASRAKAPIARWLLFSQCLIPALRVLLLMIRGAAAISLSSAISKEIAIASESSTPNF